MRMAQARARNRPAPLQLPPLENMHAVQSALTQVMEALATDMLDTKRAQGIVSVLRVAANNLKRPDAWRPSEYQNLASENDAAEPSVTSYDDFEAEYGLPQDIDINIPPDVAFPPPQSTFSELSSRAGVEGYAVSGSGESPESRPAPVAVAKAGVFAADPHSPAVDVRPDFPISPETVEVCEIYATHGADAAQVRSNQLERNRQRRQLNTDRKRFAQIALQRNLQIAAQQIAQAKLAAAQSPQPETPPAKKPSASAVTDAPESTPLEAKSGS
jgi:hypothetical protein